ncbi:endonuclease domain-containing protein [Aurantimonas sp. HBX-1]|nr:endonuclease domain-containing protein [Aurantimonas sp. HBX-1]
MRADPTAAERRFWHRVRAGRLGGLKFRRQVPMLGIIADFVCAEALLVVELDGWQHRGTRDGAARDASRDAALAEAGYLVLRFDNEDVLADLDAVAVAVRVLAVARERIGRHAEA